MRVLIDKYVPYLRGVLEPYAEVRYLEPEDFTPAAVWEADALIIRTRTKVNATLLEGSRVRLVATATIGYDHIDTNYCEQHGIRWVNAPGCNAQAVCDYIEEALNEIERVKVEKLKDEKLKDEKLKAGNVTLGVVGVGFVGSLVADMASQKGLEVLVNDPPKGIGVALDEIARKSDIISFHTPLNREGEYSTYHMCDEAFLSQCRPGAIIINAARGGIVDEAALLESGHPYIIDTWEAEPHINHDVLKHAMIATPHIAGYSIQGKVNASNACLKAVCEVLNLPKLTIDRRLIPAHGDSDAGWLMRQTEILKQNPIQFEQQRHTYPLR